MVLKTYLSEFSKHLKEISFPTEEERIKESWDIQGVLKDKSNQLLKFDVRPIKIQETGELGKEGNLGIKADKFVFETFNSWVIIDVKELHQYIVKNKLTVVNLQEILDKIDWNIILYK